MSTKTVHKELRKDKCHGRALYGIALDCTDVLNKVATECKKSLKEKNWNCERETKTVSNRSRLRFCQWSVLNRNVCYSFQSVRTNNRPPPQKLNKKKKKRQNTMKDLRSQVRVYSLAPVFVFYWLFTYSFGFSFFAYGLICLLPIKTFCLWLFWKWFLCCFFSYRLFGPKIKPHISEAVLLPNYKKKK